MKRKFPVFVHDKEQLQRLTKWVYAPDGELVKNTTATPTRFWMYSPNKKELYVFVYKEDVLIPDIAVCFFVGSSSDIWCRNNSSPSLLTPLKHFVSIHSEITPRVPFYHIKMPAEKRTIDGLAGVYINESIMTHSPTNENLFKYMKDEEGVKTLKEIGEFCAY